MQFFLDFEKPLVALDQKIRELRDYTTDNVDFSSDIKKLEKKSAKLRDEIFSNLTRWQRTQLARHQVRPYTLDYVQHIFTDWFVPVLMASPARSSVIRKGAIPRRRFTGISACRIRKDIARLCAL
jgi:hypothetical protein